MRQLAAAGSILLACLLGFAPSAYARTRHTASHDVSVRSPSGRAVLANRFVFRAAYRFDRVASVSRRRVSEHAGGPLSITPRKVGMADLVLSTARRYGVPASLAYGIASVESGFNPHARSRAGALGLMQIMPSTARDLGCRGSLSNAGSNADCGMRYLAQILHDHGGDVRVTAAMYNQGRYARTISRQGARYAALVLRHSRRYS